MTIGSIVAICIIFGFMTYEVITFGRNNKKVSSIKYDDAEIQVIDLLHLVETENRKVFAELIAYHGNHKNSKLKRHVELKTESENETNDQYFNSVQKIIDECYELKPPTGIIDKDFSFVITDSYAVTKEDYEIVQVKMKYCSADEEECIDTTYIFDFVKVGKEYLLLDIENMELYKK